MMTESQRQAAARALCELRGVNPEAVVAHQADPNPDGSIPLYAVETLALDLAMREIIAQDQLEEAMRVGRGNGRGRQKGG